MQDAMTTKDIWIRAGRISDIPRLGGRVVRAGGRDIAIFRSADDRIFALDDRCPHRGGPLSQGIVHGERVTCPLHNWVIGLSDGEAVAPDEGCVRRHRIRTEGDSILLSVDPG